LIRALAVCAVLLVAATVSSRAADRLDFPPLTGRVVDEAGVLPPQAVERLTRELAAHEQRTGQQVVVAVVRSLQGQSIEDYGYQLGRFWGIGQKKADNGAIVVVAPSERKVRIEVGYGLEGELTDAVSSVIIGQTILPRFRMGDLAGGIVAGTEQVLRALGDDVGEPLPPRSGAQGAEGPESVGSILFTLIIFFIFFWLARRGGGGFFLPFLIASSWGGGRRGGRGGGSFGGGGFSGGGGSFGGGGASGSW
jgi:uncharacterized protein